MHCYKTIYYSEALRKHKHKDEDVYIHVNWFDALGKSLIFHDFPELKLGSAGLWKITKGQKYLTSWNTALKS